MSYNSPRDDQTNKKMNCLSKYSYYCTNIGTYSNVFCMLSKIHRKNVYVVLDVGVNLTGKLPLIV